jgi:hypothetical protein
MGEQTVDSTSDDQRLRAFTKAILADVKALEMMLAGDLIERGVRRIGAEQEMFLVDRRLRPARSSPTCSRRCTDPPFTTELARFNLEANLTRRCSAARACSEMEDELNEVIGMARDAARACGADVLLTGSCRPCARRPRRSTT